MWEKLLLVTKLILRTRNWLRFRARAKAPIYVLPTLFDGWAVVVSRLERIQSCHTQRERRLDWIFYQEKSCFGKAGPGTPPLDSLSKAIVAPAILSSATA